MSGRMSIRQAESFDIASVARVHTCAFDDFFLSKMGPAFLRVYYGLVIECRGGILLVAEEDERLLGFVAGFVDPPGFYDFMSTRKLRLVVPILLGLIRRPALLGRVFFNTRRVSNCSHDEAGEGCELSSIGVLPQAAGKGLGASLMGAFCDAAAGRGCSCVKLTTDADDNDATNSFYRRLGFSLSRSFVTGKRQMNEYRRELP